MPDLPEEAQEYHNVMLTHGSYLFEDLNKCTDMGVRPRKGFVGINGEMIAFAKRKVNVKTPSI